MDNKYLDKTSSFFADMIVPHEGRFENGAVKGMLPIWGAMAGGAIAGGVAGEHMGSDFVSASNMTMQGMGALGALGLGLSSKHVDIPRSIKLGH